MGPRDTSQLVGAWRWEVERGVFFADARVCRLFGVPAEWGRCGAMSERFSENLHHEDRAALRASLPASVGRGEPFDVGYRIIDPLAEPVRVRSLGLPVREPGGATPRTYVGVILLVPPAGETSSVADDLVEHLAKAHALAETLDEAMLARLIEAVLLEAGRRLANRLDHVDGDGHAGA